ncbi:MAG: tetratricopeptide repeat protein [Verrucomicrobia bacterium]|nr:tetratricopeptide repeat protein [Verrucomicrobiota bacterium]
MKIRTMHSAMPPFAVFVAAFALACPLVAAEPKHAPSGKAPPAKPKWNVTHQLVQGQPWHSVKKSEQELRADVKESEATPDQRLVLALDDLGGWYRGKARYDDAEKVYRRVLGLQIKRGLEMHYDLALTHNDLGVVLTEAGRHPEAEKAFKAAKELWEKRWDGPLPTEDHAVTLHNYAVLLEKIGRGDEAKSLEAKADEIMAIRKKAIEGI